MAPKSCCTSAGTATTQNLFSFFSDRQVHSVICVYSQLLEELPIGSAKRRLDDTLGIKISLHLLQVWLLKSAILNNLINQSVSNKVQIVMDLQSERELMPTIIRSSTGSTRHS
ncbi:hypothetical protein EJB05_16667, partial [Eragrostis curvula]